MTSRKSSPDASLVRAAPRRPRIPTRLVYAGIFGGGALVWTAAAILIPGWGGLAAWPAFSFWVATAAYCREGHGVFRKGPAGRHAPWAYPWVWPFCTATTLAWHVRRRFDREAPSHEIVPGLRVGRRPLPGEVGPEVDLIVDLTCEMRAHPAVIRGRDYLCLPTLDALPPPAESLFAAAVRLARHRGTALIHCAQGQGRSATLAAAVLIVRGHADTVAAAESLLKSRRSKIRLRPEQFALLQSLLPRLIAARDARPAVVSLQESAA